jgi:hypothetical protein
MVEGGDQPKEVKSLLATAEALRRSGRLAEARSRFMDASIAAEAVGDTRVFISAALGVGGIWVQEQRDVVARAAVASLWQRARDRAETGSLEELRLLVRQSAEAVYEGGPVEAVITAVQQVRAFGDHSATAEALSLLHHVQLGPRYADERSSLADEIIRSGTAAKDVLMTLMGLCWRTVDLFQIGDPRAGQSLEELRERSEAEACDAMGFIADVLTAMVLARSGRLVEAEATASSALERGTLVGDPDALAYYGAMLATLRWWQGRQGEVIDVVRKISTSPRLGYNDHVYVAADALLSAALGDFDSTEEALARLNGIGLGELAHSSSWLTTQFLVVEAAYAIGDEEVASTASELLTPYAHLPVVPSVGVVCLGSVERALGLSAATNRDADAAIHHLEAALHADRRLGNRPMAILTEAALAGVLRARGAEGDEARAEQLSGRAAGRAALIGIKLPDPPSWLVSRRLTSSKVRSPREARLESCSKGWLVVSEGRVTLLPERVGLGYLADLISLRGQDLDVLSLASPDLVDGRVSYPLADSQALNSYRRRALELRDLIDRNEIDHRTVDTYREELVAIDTVLRASTGLGGRKRFFSDNDQRARTAVRKALVRAIAAIELVEPDFGHHLRCSVVTGITCRYSPAVGWNVTAKH